VGELTYRTAGESHGRGCFAFVEGFPFGVTIDSAFLNAQLARRQKGYGRGGRQQIETDQVELLSGVRQGRAMGSPILLAIWNKDSRLDETPELTCPRPGHADLAGHLKRGAPIRDVLERSSARETSARVAAGALCRLLLREFGVEVRSHVVAIGGAEVPEDYAPGWDELAKADESDVRCLHAATADRMRQAIDRAKEEGSTVGGVFEIVVHGLPAGLGDFTQWDRKLDGKIGQAILAIQALKGVEIGLGFRAARRSGRDVHDPIEYRAPDRPLPTGGFTRPTNGAGGLEGGMTTGAPIVVRAAMKPISTLKKPLASVDLKTGKPKQADFERSDYCAVPAASVVAENVLAIVFAQALVEKFGNDSQAEMRRNYEGYLAQISRPLGP
jgi:chorismate synthase